MNQALLFRQPLTSVVLQSRHHKYLRQSVFFAIGLAALTLSAKFAILTLPVPITLQSLVVLFLGMIYGWRLGCITVASYLLLGTIGLPVFAGPIAGPAVLLGMTGGYLLGFLPAAFISGLITEYGWGRYYFSTAIAALIGMSVIYFYGVFWLAKFVGISAAVDTGLTPFLMVCVLKILVLTLTVPNFWKPMKKHV